jgi:hypothetical protein
MRTILLTSALLSTLAFAQEQKPSPSVEVRAVEGAAKWIQQLGSDSYRDRLQAENELRKLGETARKALEAAAADGGDSEVQWRAKRLLRQIGKAAGRDAKDGAGRGLVERGRDRAPAGREPEIVERGERRGAPRDLGDMRAEFDRIFKRFEEMGLDVPSRRFFDEPFFKDLESQLDRGPAGARAGQSMNVQIGPDGVRVEVTEAGADGKPETKVYEAEDMEAFQKKHPGVLKGNGLRMGFGGPGLDLDLDNLRGRVGELQRGFDWDLVRPRVLRLPQAGEVELDELPAAPMPQRGRRLGITTKPIPDALRDYLELGPKGLMVGEVQDGTLAKACGLQVDDIVVAIGGKEIASPADVAEALGAIGKGKTVRVEYVRRGQRKTAEAEKQHDAAPKREPIKPAATPKPRQRIR